MLLKCNFTPRRYPPEECEIQSSEWTEGRFSSSAQQSRPLLPRETAVRLRPVSMETPFFPVKLCNPAPRLHRAGCFSPAETPGGHPPKGQKKYADPARRAEAWCTRGSRTRAAGGSPPRQWTIAACLRGRGFLLALLL